jgi:NAD(P)H-flavin reductase
VEAWAERGARVVLCLSRAELEHHRDLVPAAERVSGYVQHALSRAIGAGTVGAGSLVVAAGPASMLQAVRGLSGAVEVVTNV